MAQDRIIEGTPMKTYRDGWWFGQPLSPDRTTQRPKGRPVVLLLVLILLADVLFYRHSVGLSLALFAVAVFVAVQRGTPRWGGVAVLVLSLLPVIDYVQPLSVALLSAGLIASIALSRLSADMPATLLRASLTIVRQIPWRGARDLIVATRGLHLQTDTARRFGRAWSFPLGGLLILVALLVEANPILDDWLSGLTDLPIDPAAWVQRVAFWTGVALVVWPLLVADPSATLLPQARPVLRPPMSFGLNATSVSNALMLFNGALALQTLLDARYLWSGAALPQGMTLATYAHRGAYPLLATALLAGAFALAARPWVAERRALKTLLYLWLTQNILLTLSALYRLDLYVQAYGLTYLRIHALVWMGLVAAGLTLTLAQVAAGKTNLWLLIRCTALGGGTLYLCAFVNFADIIARVNVAEGKIDPDYLCALGPTAAAAIPPSLKWPPGDSICIFEIPQVKGWRDWGFRNWRVLHNLQTQEARP
jgi:hypothetical protein